MRNDPPDELVLIPWPGRTVHIEQALPLVDGAQPARVRQTGWPDSELQTGAMTGWYPNRLLGRTRAEAERLRAAEDAAVAQRRAAAAAAYAAAQAAA